MKKLILPLSVWMTLLTLVYGGGEIVPVKQNAEEALPIEKSGLYAGIGLSWLSLENELSGEEFSANGIMLQLGYQVNDYIGIEGRYTHHIGDLEYDHGTTINKDDNDFSGDFINTALYLKGMYPIGDFVPYVLLGYGEVALTNLPLGGPGISADRAERGFQWGIGGAYNVMEEMAVFVDYVKLYDDVGFDGRAQKADIESDSWTFGITYKF
jgi:opacity protein-like surface antigen